MNVFNDCEFYIGLLLFSLYTLYKFQSLITRTEAIEMKLRNSIRETKLADGRWSPVSELIDEEEQIIILATDSIDLICETVNIYLSFLHIFPLGKICKAQMSWIQQKQVARLLKY
jgi:hypothetical protein